MPIDIHRYYRVAGDGPATISILPSFLLSRKRKKIQVFLDMMGIMSREEKPLETVWREQYQDNHFPDLKSLYRYRSCLLRQIDSLILSLSTQVIKLKGDCILADINPDENNSYKRIRLLYALMDELTELLHRKGLSIPFTENEKYYYLNFCVFHFSGIVFLNSS